MAYDGSGCALSQAQKKVKDISKCGSQCFVQLRCLLNSKTDLRFLDFLLFFLLNFEFLLSFVLPAALSMAG